MQVWETIFNIGKVEKGINLKVQRAFYSFRFLDILSF